MLSRKYFVEARVGKSELADYLLAIKHDARVMTMHYLKNITEDELDWQPFEGWNSIAALLSHIIACDRYFTIAFIEDRELTELEKNEIMPAIELGKYASGFKGQSASYYMERLQATYEDTRKAIINMGPDALLKRRFDDYDKVKGSDLAWILYHGAEDEVHHRGQISMIRKLYQEMKPKQS